MFFNRITPQSLSITKIKPSTTNGYEFISPLLAVDLNDVKTFPEYQKLENETQILINDYKKKGNILNASVYFRNLENGTWMGINELDEYHPGSLFKVPIMIAYLKQAEKDPNFLQTKIKFDKSALKSDPQNIPARKSIEFGKEYTVSDLIDYMIIYSDNNAANVLADKIFIDQKNSYTDMLSDLSLPINTEKLSPKAYSIFLRILYNSTFLSRDMSERALSTLSRTDFDAGIASGLPSDVKLSNKFGEYGEIQNGELIEELSDCGIVYSANKTYLLCVMTKGTDTPTQTNLIKDISATVYNTIEK